MVHQPWDNTMGKIWKIMHIYEDYHVGMQFTIGSHGEKQWISHGYIMAINGFIMGIWYMMRICKNGANIGFHSDDDNGNISKSTSISNIYIYIHVTFWP